MKAKAIVNLILPLVLLTTIFIPRVSIRADSSFIFGALLFGIVFILGYYWSVQYFLRVMRVDLRKSITRTKKDVVELEKYKFKITKLGYMLIPFALIGMFMMLELRIFTKCSLVPVSLVITVMIVSIYVTFKFSIIERFRAINRDIAEIEKLEIE